MEHEEEEVSEAGDSAGDLEMNLEDQFDCSCCVCKSFSQESGDVYTLKDNVRLAWAAYLRERTRVAGRDTIRERDNGS